tara:strand:- start:26408 stop:27604 length:1197 start_codon:yes stop_codon:yes gene_type:complete
MINSKSLRDIVLKPITGEWGSEGDTVQILRTTNFTNEGRLNFSKVVKRNVDPVRVEKKKLKVGDIIIEKSGGSPKQPVGRVVFFDKEGVFLCNNFTAILRPKEDEVVPKYLLYILYCNHKFGFTSAYQNKTTGIINLQLPKYLEGTKIPLPSLDQQKKIAAILDAADTYRQKTKALITKYDELTQSLFLDMFGDPVRNPKGWDKIKLEEIGTLSSGSTPSRKVEENFIGDIPWVKTGEVNSKIIFDTEEKISEAALKNSSCKLYPAGSLIIAMYGQGKTRGQVGLLGIDASTNQACAVLTKSDKVNFTFLYKLIQMSYEDLRSLGRGGNQPNLNSGILKKYLVFNPPRDLQNQFAERVKAIEAQKAQAEASLIQADNLFNSLLQRAFKGELTKQYPKT